MFKKTVSMAILVVFATQVTGCNNVIQSKTLDTQMGVVTALIKSEAALQLQQSSQAAVHLVNHPPALSGQLSMDTVSSRQFVTQNLTTLQLWLVSIEVQAGKAREALFDLSRQAFESADDDLIMKNQTLIYLGLQYQRAIYKGLLQVASPLAMGASASSLKDVTEVQELKKELTDKLFGFSGVVLVADQDITRPLGILGKYRQNGLLP